MVHETARSVGKGMDAGSLYVVATPIGNLEDISARAVRVLREVHLIAAEDTRHSRRLLNHFDITTSLRSYHEHNEEGRTDELLAVLASGKHVALITDAGTPCISDPGYRLVHQARESGYDVVTIPGPCAVTAALSISGLPTDSFAFHGFFPRKQGDAKRRLDAMAEWPATHVFYEAPGRLTATLAMLADRFPEAPTAVARELTKKFEELQSGSPDALREHFAHTRPRGECVVMIHVAPAERGNALSDDVLCEHVADAMTVQGLSQRDAIRHVAATLGIPRNRVYAAATRTPCKS